jgi:CBS domain-containing protein
LTAKELISSSVFPIQTSDTGEEALQMMQVYHVRHLPIVNHEQLLGIISEDDILIHDTQEPVGSYRLSYLRPYCFENDHFFEVMTKMGRLKITVIPVIDHEEKYLGIVTMEDLLRYFATNYSFAEPGSIIVIETARGNYSLSEIARLAESDDITLLSTFTHTVPDSQVIYVTLKVNRQDVSSFKAALERFGYQIAGVFSEVDYQDNLKERYDALMSYLNV